MKHSKHSHQRALDRAGGGIKEIRTKLARKEYTGLAKQTNNKRCSLIELKNGKKVVAVWSKAANKIITILSLEQYTQRYGDLIQDPKIKEKLEIPSN